MDTTSTEAAPSQAARRAVSAEEWRHLYTVTGFALVLEGILADIMLGERAAAALLVWLILGALTFCLAVYNPGTRDALLRAKERFESEHGPGAG